MEEDDSTGQRDRPVEAHTAAGLFAALARHTRWGGGRLTFQSEERET